MPQSTPQHTGIYAVYDKVADAIIGGLHLHKHDAAAIRMFSDAASASNSIIGMHPQDFDLLQLGELAPDNTIETTSIRIITTGEAWLASQQQEPTNG